MSEKKMIPPKELILTKEQYLSKKTWYDENYDSESGIFSIMGKNVDCVKLTLQIITRQFYVMGETLEIKGWKAVIDMLPSLINNEEIRAAFITPPAVEE